jgi:hypothetical protein
MWIDAFFMKRTKVEAESGGMQRSILGVGA